MAKAKMGEMIVVKNNEKHPNANDEYVALWVESESGDEDTERCLLFRRNFVESLTEVKFGDGFETSMKKGRMYRMSIGKQNFFVCLVQDVLGHEKIFRFTDKMIVSGEELSRRNPEDIPDRGWWNDMKD